MAGQTGQDKKGLLGRTVYVVVVSLGFGLLFDLFFYEKLPGISFPLYIMLILGGIFVAARYFKTDIPRSAVLLMIPLLFFSCMVFVWAGGFITFLNIVISLYLLALILQAVFKPGVRIYNLAAYLRPLYLIPARLIGALRGTILEIGAMRSMVKKHPALPQIARGVLIAVPVLALFVMLFASADLVFRKYVSNLFSFDINGEWLLRTCIILFVTSALIGIFGYLASKGKEESAPTIEAEAKALAEPRGTIEAAILFGSLNLLFLGFILVQLTYFFGGEQSIAAQGFTYAEYARKGFFELIAVAVLSLLLILGAEKRLLGKSGKHSRWFTLLAAGLVAQVLIIMASAFQRLSLYESAYGFTTLRALSHLFIIWLAVIFGLLLYKIFVDKRESTFAFLAFLSVLVFLAVINIANVDAFVARKNIGRYYASGKLDVYYLGDLSDDAVVETAKLLDGPDPKLGGLAGSLYQKREALIEKDRYWQSMNISRKAALRALQAKAHLLEQETDIRIYNRS
ncbi:MAG TPA: DUF4173 domain-containing protein [Candidatus Saccharimonadales bacterium]|nr:DUF4173 domain-containing protein [Candidatus Saccharimonadales bacterium]